MAPVVRLGPAVVAAVLLGVLVPAPASAAPGVNCAGPGEAEVAVSWPRLLLRADAVAPIADGGGVTVAVLSTGVDAGQPRLDNRVLTGVDVVNGATPPTEDCTGVGTQVAGVIAGQRDDRGDAGAGLAPNSRILPIRVLSDDPVGPQGEPDDLARGITAAVQNGAEVIVVAAAVYEDDPALETAVADAVAEEVLVVAAAGDLGGPDAGNPTPYPAAYRDVLGVGAIDQDGRIAPDSHQGEFVDLVAPGVAVPTLQTGRGVAEVDGTAVAAGFVGAAAALIRDRRTDLGARAVAKLLIATAGPAPIGPAFGAGVVDPQAALTGQLVAGEERPLPGAEPVPLPDTATESRRRAIALTSAGLAGIVVVALLVVAAAVRRSRRQRWRPGLAATPPAYAEPLEPGPPLMLLDDPADAARR